MLRALLLTLVAAQVVFGHSAIAQSCSETRCSGRITQLYLHPNKNLYIQTTAQDQVSSLDCSVVDEGIVLPTSDPLFESFYTMLLTGLAADRPMVVRIRNGSNPCTVNYLVIK
jgi:hypothetical protein